jgi:hypothetical protein
MHTLLNSEFPLQRLYQQQQCMEDALGEAGYAGSSLANGKSSLLVVRLFILGQPDSFVSTKSILGNSLGNISRPGIISTFTHTG